MAACRCMIVDDFDVLAEDLKEAISTDPEFEVVAIATSGREAVALTEKCKPDIILMDIEMESQNAGIKASEQILASHPDVKIIFLTAHETEGTIITAMATGAVDYLVKGCDGEHVLYHLRAVRDGEMTLDPKIRRIVLDEYQRLRRSEQSLLFFIQRLSSLTPTEKELVRYFLEGDKIRDIAAKRFVEASTVKTQVHSLLVKFGCKRTSEIVEMVTELGISHLFME